MEEKIRDLIIDKINTAVENVEALTTYREPVIGFADAADPKFLSLKEIIGPHVLMPKDILPNAKTVVAFFIPYSKVVVDVVRTREQFTNQEWSVAYYETNKLVTNIIKELIESLKELGVDAAAEPVTENYDPVKLTSTWPHKSCAYIAGLGTFGINQLLITPLGVAGRLCSLVISEKITPTKMPDEEYCLYIQKGLCGKCADRCPTGGLTRESYDRFKCNEHTTMRDKPAYMDRGCCRCSTGPCAYFMKERPNHVYIGRRRPNEKF